MVCSCVHILVAIYWHFGYLEFSSFPILASRSPYFTLKETWLVHLANLPHLIPDSLPSVFQKKSQSIRANKTIRLRCKAGSSIRSFSWIHCSAVLVLAHSYKFLNPTVADLGPIQPYKVFLALVSDLTWSWTFHHITASQNFLVQVSNSKKALDEDWMVRSSCHSWSDSSHWNFDLDWISLTCTTTVQNYHDPKNVLVNKPFPSHQYS